MNYLARVNAGGTLDTNFNPNVNGTSYSAVYSLALQTDGKILIAGQFTSVGGTLRNPMARLNADGTLDTGFNPNVSGSVSSVAVQADGRILLGGSYIARLLNGPATQTLTVPDTTQLQWLRGGTAPELEQVTFELNTNGGTNWTSLGNGTRINGGWSATGLSLPNSGMIRARGGATAGGSSSLIEQVASYGMRPVLSLPARLPGPQLQFTLTGAPGSSYIIQAATNLTGSLWVPVFTNPSPFTFIDPNASNYPQRFYRGVLP